MHPTTPTLHVVAGPNGSGKSALTRAARFGTARVIDPDPIARGLGRNVGKGISMAAGREAARQRRVALARGETFVLETAIPGKAIVRIMDQARLAGFWLRCTSSRRTLLAKQSTGSRTESRSAVTTFRRQRFGGDLLSRWQICPRRFHALMKLGSTTIPAR